ncbi:hypothetical protein [Dactylosporangium sp. NPDC051484]|uniref:hypothetical protein n=1 Tax=Dactylosporangium sp. NPDC051484 TaxID=3154942 RepID=UPI00344B7A1C
MVVLVLPLAAAMAVAAPASADDGDGTLNCVNGEICFRENANNSNNVKHFWNGANHWQQENCQLCHIAYRFTGTNHYVMDNANSVRNRDTICTVTLWDVDRYGVWFNYANFQWQSDSYLPVYNVNNGHSRCSFDPPNGL